ncbi:MAG: nitroreductase [Clostridia bacterium]|nr:nitroreductase [Clostridia bacterium]
MNFYNEIFKRKSFHIFRNTENICDDELKDIEQFLKRVKPLDESIKTETYILPERETTCKRGGQYCILFYSETKNDYLRNIGYIGEQIDLYLASKNIGALWFGIGRPKEKQLNGLDYVIMISIAKMSEDKFRKDMFKAKRKPLDEIWIGETMNIAEIVRFTPSACNTQPWFVENVDNELLVYRYKKPGKRGIMPANLVRYYNKIDSGIFLYMLETCLEHENFKFERELFADNTDDSVEKTLIAKYTYLSK